MANTSITIYPQYNSNQVTNINCGTSSPRIGGTIDISSFPNLISFTCVDNYITSFQGFANCPNLTYVSLTENKIAGNFNNIFPNLSNRLNLTSFTVRNNLITGTIPSLSALTNVFFLGLHGNQLTGTIPSLSGCTNLGDFRCYHNYLTGSIPSLDALTKLRYFYCSDQFGPTKLTGSIPNLSKNTALVVFSCQNNQLTGSIPSLSGLSNLLEFHCHVNFLTGFDGGSISSKLGTFFANDNQLTQSAVDTILSAFDASTRTTGTRILSLQTNNSAPSYTGGVTTVSAGNLFTTLGTTVTAACNNHNHPNGSLVTITGPQSVFTGTFAISSINANQFRYTVTTNSPTLVTGTGTATMRRTTNTNDGFRSYQNLALVTRLGGYPWNININFP
jgi:hypothetical protein